MQNNSFVSNLVNGINNRVGKILQNQNKKASLSWLKIKKLKHLSTGPIRDFEYHGKSISYTHPQDLLHTLKEIFVHEIYRLDLPKNPYIIDCGSNIGLSVIYLKEKFPDAEILAFEPDKNNFQLLQKNVKTFNFEKVNLEEKAVWTSDAELNFSNDGDMGSKIEKNNSNKASIKVQATQLKNYINKPVHFLKIDIEGAEYEVLKDIKEKLHLVENLFLEYHGKFEENNQLIEILNIVQNAGFKFYIKEAANVYDTPFLYKEYRSKRIYDVQLNIFCFKQ